jgi:hypothetical protein
MQDLMEMAEGKYQNYQIGKKAEEMERLDMQQKLMMLVGHQERVQLKPASPQDAGFGSVFNLQVPDAKFMSPAK